MRKITLARVAAGSAIRLPVPQLRNTVPVSTVSPTMVRIQTVSQTVRFRPIPGIRRPRSRRFRHRRISMYSREAARALNS
jgi:hypothetical protein